VNVIDRFRRHLAYRSLKLTFAVCAAILAVAVVTTVSIDLGPLVRGYAETFGSRAWQRPIHIGKLSLRLLTGHLLVEDFSIEGLTHADRPFFAATRLDVALDWSTLFEREVTIRAVDMTGWRMLVEKWEDRNNFPKFVPDDDEPRRARPFTTTLKYLRASRGEFNYEDHDAPWSIVARNVDLNITNRPRYHGTVSFTGGTVTIQDSVPFWADMKARFVLDGPRVHLDQIEFETDGASTRATGDVDLGHWPEQSYQFKSHVQFVRMRHIFFKNETWELAGEGDVAGTFHLFHGGRDLVGTFTSPVLGVNSYRFSQLSGALHWTPALFEVSRGAATSFGGRAAFSYSIQPLGADVPATARFEASFAGIDLASFSDHVAPRGFRIAGTADGSALVIEWPLGRFAESRGSGRLAIAPPSGVYPMSRWSPAVRTPDRLPREWGPFAPPPLPAHVPLAGVVAYRFDPDLITIEPSELATEHTAVTFQGTTAWGRVSRIAFHVASSDWQESDELLAGILTDFGSTSRPVTFGGRGEFEGTMLGLFRSPRVEGEFTGDDLRAFDAWWGSGRASVVVENDYVTVTDGVIHDGDSEMRVDGLFSLGFPREDGGDQIDARIRVSRRDINTLRHAFGIDEYPITGLLSGEFHLTGEYQHPIGFGGMTLDEFMAYGEPVEGAAASLRFDGTGVRLDNVTAGKGGGQITGAAFIGWDSTYSFNFDGRRIPVASIAKLANLKTPLSGLGEFTATGSATFDLPRNDFKFRISDLRIGAEEVGEMNGSLALRGTDLSGGVDAASPQLAITATGRIALTAVGESELTVRFHDVSLDPYVRMFVPRFSPFTTAVASGSLRVAGPVSDIDRLIMDGTIDTVDLRVFDYLVKNDAPIRLSLNRRTVTVEALKLVGEDTRLRVAGVVGLGDERIALKVDGDANIGLLQGFFRDVRGSGRAELIAAIDGPLREPVLSGRATISGGRIRHFSLPNSLDAINGVIQFDRNGIRLDELTATLGGGQVQFGGRIGLSGYEPTEINVTASGSNVQLRWPTGLRSVVDAELALRGTFKAPALGGTVTVKSAVFDRRVDETDLFQLMARNRESTRPGGAAGGEPGTPAVPLRLDVEIAVPSTLRVDNNIGRLLANGDFFLRGTLDRPAWFGHADVERGDLVLLGRRYRVTKGSIDLVNPSKFDPLFDVEVETNVRIPGQTYRATVGAVGTVERLSFSVSSDPPLPASDVLSLLFSDVRRNQDVEIRARTNPGQNATDILTTRATQLLASPISSGVGRVMERTIGVDTFELTPSLINPDPDQPTTSRLNAAARLTIGKRISNRAYLTFSRSLATSVNDQIIVLEIDATDRLSWVMSRNEDNQTFAVEFRVRRAF
jgi:hypothetical protein